MTALTVLSAPLTTDASHYIQAGVFSISVANATVILLMIIVFILALVIPFPRPHEDETTDGDRP